jgi:hypothetical protein
VCLFSRRLVNKNLLAVRQKTGMRGVCEMRRKQMESTIWKGLCDHSAGASAIFRAALNFVATRTLSSNPAGQPISASEIANLT